MRQLRNFGLLLASLSCLPAALLGCGGEASGGAAHLPTVVNANVVVLSRDGSVQVASVADSSVTLSGTVPSLPPGSIIVGSAGQGLLRKVTSTTLAATGTVVQTTPATLTDVFQQADFSFQKPLAATDFTTITPLLPGITVGPNRANGAHTRDILSIDLHFANVQFPGDSDAPGVLQLTGDLRLGVSVNFAFQADLHGVKYCRFVPEVKDDINLTAAGKLTYTFAQLKKKIAHLQGSPIVIEVGPVPVVFVPVLDVYLQADGNVVTGFEFTSSVGMDLQAGVEYTREQGWHPVSNVDHHATFVPEPNVYASVSGSFTPALSEMELLVYGTAGPYVTAQCPTIEMEIKRQTNPAGLSVSADALFAASAGVKVEVLAHDLADVDFSGALEERIGLIDHVFPDNGNLDATLRSRSKQ